MKIKKWHGDVYIRPVMHQNTPTKRAQNSQEAGIVSTRTHPLFHLPMEEKIILRVSAAHNLQFAFETICKEAIGSTVPVTFHRVPQAQREAPDITH